MSFVGTRPEAVKYVEKYKPEYMATLLLPAGITSEATSIGTIAIWYTFGQLLIVKLNNYNANCFQNNLQKIFSKSGHNIEDVILF